MEYIKVKILWNMSKYYKYKQFYLKLEIKKQILMYYLYNLFNAINNCIALFYCYFNTWYQSFNYIFYFSLKLSSLFLVFFIIIKSKNLATIFT